MGEAPSGLWTTGTYWHLETRPDELDVLDDAQLKAAAEKIDRQLSEARFQTFVHGDAKLANFCFAETGAGVAAVDFQYVGGGCGMKDVAYFISSCLDESSCEAGETELLDCYFGALKRSLSSTLARDPCRRGRCRVARTVSGRPGGFPSLPQGLVPWALEDQLVQ